MASTTFNIIALILLVIVVIVLVKGLLNMMKGGSPERSNKLMQARIFFQFIALLFIMAALWFSY